MAQDGECRAKPLDSMAFGLELHLGTWHGMVNFFVVPLDDFIVVLGMEFLQQLNMVPLSRSILYASWKEVHAWSQKCPSVARKINNFPPSK